MKLLFSKRLDNMEIVNYYYDSNKDEFLADCTCHPVLSVRPISSKRVLEVFERDDSVGVKEIFNVKKDAYKTILDKVVKDNL